MNQTNVVEVVAHVLAGDGTLPNNEFCPLLIYPGAVVLDDEDPAAVFEALFVSNRWIGCWRNGIYPFHHYHSATHEALGIFSGSATVQFGGKDGVTVSARPGDVIVLPAGVGHKKVNSRGTLGVVGAYPIGQRPDLCMPQAARAQNHARAVAAVPLPEFDPVYGADGPLFAHWRRPDAASAT